jgi:hypothetical protein
MTPPFGTNLNTKEVLQTMLGRATRGFDESRDTVAAKINPNTTYNGVIQYNDFVKIIDNGFDPQIMVDEITSINDVPYGMILYNQRINIYNPGDTVAIVKQNSYVNVLAGENITAGDLLEWDYVNKKIMIKTTGQQIGKSQTSAIAGSAFEMQIIF